MTKSSLATILFASLCSLVAVSCAPDDAGRVASSAAAPDGDCHDPEDTCDGGGGDQGDDGGGGGDDGGGGDGGGGGGGDCGCNECGCDVDLDVEISADIALDVSGTGVYVGLDSCGQPAVAGEFEVSLDASGVISGEDDLSCTITGVSEASLEIDVGNGCTCDGLTAEVVASGSASVTIDANAASCDLACDLHAEADAKASCDADDGDTSCEGNAYAAAHFSCMATCELAASITASANLDASANVDLDADDASSYIGAELDLDLDAMLDAEGDVILSLD